VCICVVTTQTQYQEAYAELTDLRGQTLRLKTEVANLSAERDAAKAAEKRLLDENAYLTRLRERQEEVIARYGHNYFFVSYVAVVFPPSFSVFLGEMVFYYAHCLARCLGCKQTA
jgi:hypothetical protein